jgi:hypothetical protein
MIQTHHSINQIHCQDRKLIFIPTKSITILKILNKIYSSRQKIHSTVNHLKTYSKIE